MKTLIPISFFVLFSLFSCSEKIELDIPDSEPQIVVFSLMKPDSLINVRLSMTLPMLSIEPFAIVTNAEVQLLANGIFIENLQLIGDSIYKSSIPAQAEVNYEIYIDVPGFEQIHASATIPELVNITTGIIEPDVNYNHQMAHYESEVEISFYDPPNIDNYYQVSFYSHSTSYYNEVWFMHSKDPIIINEGDLQFYTGISSIKSLVFSDKLLNEQTDVRFLIYLFFRDSVDPFVIFRSINRDYYKFHKSQIRQAFNLNIGRFDAINMFLVNNPNDLYSNIENGIGIFAGYSETHFELEVIE